MRSRNDGKIIILLIATLVAFGIGSGFGISMGLSGDDPLVQNETNETKMPINVNMSRSQYKKRGGAFGGCFSVQARKQAGGIDYV